VKLRMPGKSFAGELPPATAEVRELATALERDVRLIAEEIGERHVGIPGTLERTASAIEDSLREAGFTPERQSYTAHGHEVANIEVEIPGHHADEIVVVGAHYDTVPGTPGANDNGSGVAAVLALARALSGKSLARTLRLVAFVNEEPPFFQTPAMGSWQYAHRCRERGENIAGMLSLETIGYFSDLPDSQMYPFPFSLFYPKTGNFIGFVGNSRSSRLVAQVTRLFREHASFPSEGAALPGAVTGIGWSDHWSFWQHGYPALMVTDTAPFRYSQYHMPGDTPDRIDFERMARVVDGVARVIVALGS